MSRINQHQYFAREGRPLFLVLFLLTLLLDKLFGFYWGLPVLLLLLIALFLYRDPQRQIPPLPLAVLSPADAQVVYVKKDIDPYLKRQAIRIRLRLHSYGSFGLRSPIEGKVAAQWVFRERLGEKPLHVDEPVSTNKGVHYVVRLTTDEDDEVVIALEMPHWWQRFQCFVQVGERIGQGGRCGRLRFGGFIELFIPDSSILEAGHLDNVVAGVSVLARLRHS